MVDCKLLKVSVWVQFTRVIQGYSTLKFFSLLFKNEGILTLLHCTLYRQNK